MVGRLGVKFYVRRTPYEAYSLWNSSIHFLVLYKIMQVHMEYVGLFIIQ